MHPNGLVEVYVTSTGPEWIGVFLWEGDGQATEDIQSYTRPTGGNDRGVILPASS